MSTLPLSEVKARFSEIAEEVDRTHERVRVTRNGREYVVLISAEDLESLEATIELLSDSEAVDLLGDLGETSLDLGQWESAHGPILWSIGARPPLAVLARRTTCLLYTSDAADDLLCVDLGGRRIIKKKKKQ